MNKVEEETGEDIPVQWGVVVTNDELLEPFCRTLPTTLQGCFDACLSTDHFLSTSSERPFETDVSQNRAEKEIARSGIDGVPRP